MERACDACEPCAQIHMDRLASPSGSSDVTFHLSVGDHTQKPLSETGQLASKLANEPVVAAILQNPNRKRNAESPSLDIAARSLGTTHAFWKIVSKT